MAIFWHIYLGTLLLCVASILWRAGSRHLSGRSDGRRRRCRRRLLDGGSVCGDDNDDSAETEHCSMAPGCLISRIGHKAKAAKFVADCAAATVLCAVADCTM